MTLNIIVYCCWEKHREAVGFVTTITRSPLPGKLRESKVRTTSNCKKDFTKGFHSKVKRPLPSSKNPHFQNEAKCTTFLVELCFICMRMKNHLHINGWVLNLVLILRRGGTRKFRIVEQFSNRCFIGKRPQKMAPGLLANSPTQRYWHRDQVQQLLPYKKGNSGRRLDIRDTRT